MLKNNIILTILYKELLTLVGFLNPYFEITYRLFKIYQPYLVFSVLIIAVLWVIYQVIKLYLSWKESSRPATLFEVAPPTSTEQSSFTTTQLFTSVHGLLRQRSWLLRLFDVTKSYSFEIASTKEKGIRYILRLSTDDAQIIKKNLIAYLPGIQVKETSDYLNVSDQGHVIDIGLTNHFAFPLKKQDNLAEYDPIAYITGTMTKLAENELVAVQMIVSPVSRSTAQFVGRLRSLFLGKKDVLSELKGSSLASSVFITIVYIGLQILLFPLGLVIWIVTGGREGPILSINSLKGQLPDSTYRDIVETQIKQKIDQQLFTVSLRYLTVSSVYSSRSRIEKGFIAALSPFTNAGYQNLRPKRYLRIKAINNLLLWLYRRRLFGFMGNLILSTSELSDLYHFPYTSITKTENLSKLHSKELPAPLSLKQKAELDIYFANNTYGGTVTKIGLTADERRRHVYILGATGTGKSTMLLSMIEQDIKNNKGLSVIDPHGDLIDQIISVIPKERIQDVVYFNPDDIGYPMGINLLELTPGLNEEDTIREKEFIAESIISVFNKIYTDKYSGPRMEYILRNTIHTAFTIPDASLFTVYKLLINTSFRKSVVRNLKDENLLDFWKYEFAKAGDYQKVKMISPITNKIGRFLFSPTAKRILEQGKSTINFDTIMNEGKILLCNLAKGKIGEDNSSVFGVLIMAKIQLAALKRARMKPEDRKDFYLYVDEFQNFATPAFAQILSEARKYKLNAILAHQTTSQLEDISLVNITLANTGTVICFRTANPEDERMILPQFRPYIEQGEIASLPSYHFYMRLGALNPEEPFSGVTVPVKIEYSQNRVDEVIESSRKLYTKKYTGSSDTSIKPKEKQISKRVYSALP
ncbi:MAG: type IV secretion system DNA-binding domain-containing protein [bacterium]